MALKMANEGIKKLRKYTDTLIIIPNQNLSKIANPKTTMQQSFAFVDKVLQSGVRSIVDLITKTGFINLDFADIRTVMKKMGRAVMGTGEASGPNRAVRAVEEAISNPLLDNISIKGAKGVILNITSSTNLTFHEYDNATKRLNEELDNVDSDAIILHGNVFDPDMQDTVRVSIFATGIDNDDYEDGEEESSIKHKSDLDDHDADGEDSIPEKEYSYVEERDADGDFFDLGETKKYREVSEKDKSNKKPEEYNKVAEKITQLTADREGNASLGAIDRAVATQRKKKETEPKKGFFSLFSSTKNKPKDEKRSEIKSHEKQEKDLSVMEVENFDSIDIDVYEVPAYLRKKNE
jgi:cell division protein FtsZ